MQPDNTLEMAQRPGTNIVLFFMIFFTWVGLPSGRDTVNILCQSRLI